MEKAITAIKGFVALMVIAFIVVFIFGVYSALNSAGALYSQVDHAPVGATAETFLSRASKKTVGQTPSYEQGSQASSAIEDVAVVAEQSLNALEADNVHSQEDTNATQPTSGERNANANSPSQEQEDQASTSPSTAPKEQSAPPTPAPEPGTKPTSPEPKPTEKLPVTYEVTVCNDCGAEFEGSIYPHQDSTGHTRYKTATRER